MRIRIDYREGISTFLRGLDQRLTDLSPFWKRHVQPYTYTVIDRIFGTEGYGRWAALSPQYAARKAITHPGQSILRRNDVYYRAATSENHSDSVTNIEPLALVLGVSTPYAQFHEQGQGVPQRAVYALVPSMLSFDADLQRLGEDYEREVIQQLQRGRGRR